MGAKKNFSILRQPDDVTCGPTCLHSIYEHFGDGMALEDVVREVPMLRGGGTLGSLLATHALRRGYRVQIYTYNLKVFDPTWATLARPQLVAKLERQLEVKRQPKFRVASRAYMEFLRLGGELQFQDLTAKLIGGYLAAGTPILAGLSATYLYKSMREHGKYPVPDDIRGEPQGHFVVLTSYDPADNTVTVADPYHPESMAYGHTYRINMDHLVCAILLGVVTYDGNLIIITKAKS
jgi:hypothetical protein